jgi:hypothetical protein
LDRNGSEAGGGKFAQHKKCKGSLKEEQTRISMPSSR